MTRRDLYKVREAESGPFILNLERGQFGIILPVARTNLVTNPSLETNTTNYTAVGGSIARSTTQQYHGAYSLAITPTAATTDGAFYGTISLTSGVTYAVSCKVLGVAGVPYLLGVYTTGGAVITSRPFRATGRWQWQWLFYTETATTTRRIYLAKNGSTSTGVFYLDGLQVEACATGEVWPTTYIDGDQLGLLSSQYPAPYTWAGTAHASISSRAATTRAGGRIVSLQDWYKFLTTAIVGLGMITPQNILLDYAQADGAVVQDIRLPSRSFSIGGFFDARSPQEIDRQKSQLGRALSRDIAGQRQPLALTYQPVDCKDDVGKMATIPCLYDGGLEGSVTMPLRETAVMSFTQYLPVIKTGDAGATIAGQQTIAANGIAQRSPSGVWSTLSTGMSGIVTVRAVCVARDGTVYAGGDFTDAGGSGADYIAKWDGSAWSVLASATALNAPVYAIVEGPDGTIYVGGGFTNANGNANADFIATWNGTTWGALSTGANNAVRAIAFNTVDGNLYVGGDFTSIGASTADFVAKWNGTAWSNLTSDTALNALVASIVVRGDGAVFVGGQFTNANGIAAADYAAIWDSVNGWQAFLAAGGPNNLVGPMALGADGRLYIGGIFTTAGGVSTPYGLAIWNGASFVAPPNAGYTQPSFIKTAPDGRVYVGWNTQNSPAGPIYTDLTIWNGASWMPTDVVSGEPMALAFRPDGTLFLATDAFSLGTGNLTTAGNTTVTNAGSAATYPRVTFTGLVSGTYTVYELNNATTGALLSLNLIVYPGETVVLDLNPASAGMTSNLFGNRNNTILPGSNLTGFLLVPGANSIVCYATNSTATIVMQWPVQYNAISDLVE